MNPYGKPNGVAYITFASPEEAHRAVNEKHKQHIGNRYVEMFIANEILTLFHSPLNTTIRIGTGTFSSKLTSRNTKKIRYEHY